MNQLRRLVKLGDLEGARGLLNSKLPAEDIGIDACDARGYTPLMHAAASPKADARMVRLLLEFGADANQWNQSV